jgi:Zn-dependent protease with chaperone function
VIAAAGLLAYAALLLAAGAPALARSAWPDRAPRLGIAAWLALATAAITSIVLGGAALMVPTERVSGGIAWLLEACQMALRAQYAQPGGVALAWLGGVLAVSVTARVGWCTVATLGATARAGHRHRYRLRLASREDAQLGAIVIDHEEPLAYCVPGTRRPVVLTTGALKVLDDAQLAAVLAHERAHQSGRHHVLVALAGVPATAFPWVPPFLHVRDQVARLAELAADDAAAARSPRLAVAEALLTLGSAREVAGALGAGGSTAAARVRRLIAAPNPLGRAASTVGMVAVAALITCPLVLLAAPAVGAFGMGDCPEVGAAAQPGPATAHCTDSGC